MRNNKKAFTLVEMLVALAVSSIIIAATYASYELIQKQYKKSIDVAEMHTSGRSIMQILEREVRMAGYEFRDATGAMTYGGIAGGLVITDSGDACCDEITIIYDEVEDVVNDLGEVTSSSVERIQTRFWTEAHTSNAGDRFRLYKRRTILGRNNAILGSPIVGAREVMADFIEDLQFANTSSLLYAGNSSTKVLEIDPVKRTIVAQIPTGGNYANGGLAFGPDGLLYAGNSGSNVLVINTVTQSVVAQISLQGNVANGGLAFGSDGLLYAGNSGFDFLVIDPVSRSIVAQIPTGGHYANGGLTFGPDGLLYAGNSGSNVLVIDPVARSVIAQISLQGNIANGGLAFRTIGSTSLVTINLTLRAKNEYGKTNKQFLKKDYFSGNFNFNKNDLFKRDTFSTSVSVRNM